MIRRIFLTLCVFSSSLTATALAGSGYRAVNYIYRADGDVVPLTELANLIQHELDADHHVVLHIHGRGKEPNKSLNKEATIRRIETQHGVTCLMFSWDSAYPWPRFLDRERALANTVPGATKFAEVLQRLPRRGTTQSNHGSLVLHVHSMGAVVLQKTVEQGRFPGERIFDAVLLTEPDCDTTKHRTWIGTLADLQPVFITLNQNDGTLKLADDGRAEGVFPLGLGTELASPDQLCQNATYLDLTGLVGKRHKVFAAGAMENQLGVFRVLNGILRGVPQLPVASDVESRAGPVVRLKSNVAPTDEAFRKAAHEVESGDD